MKTYIITELQVSDLRDALTLRVSDEEREGSIEILNALPESKDAEIERLRILLRSRATILHAKYCGGDFDKCESFGCNEVRQAIGATI